MIYTKDFDFKFNKVAWIFHILASYVLYLLF